MPLVLHIVNDPSPETTPDVQGIFKSWQAAAPVRTLLSTRSARSYYARVVLHDWLESNGGIFREIQLPEDKDLEVPLGWTLSARVVEAMEKRSAELPARSDPLHRTGRWATTAAECEKNASEARAMIRPPPARPPASAPRPGGGRASSRRSP